MGSVFESCIYSTLEKSRINLKNEEYDITPKIQK